MNLYDRDYLERREKQIRELYMMRAVSRAMALISIMLLLVILILAPSTGLLFVLGLIMLATGAIALITHMIASAETAADKAIQKEREQVAALYAQGVEKPKRQPTVHLSDDGELISDDEIAVDVRTKPSNNHHGAS